MVPLAIAAVGTLLVVAAIIVGRGGGAGGGGGGEIFLEAAAATGGDPFTEPVDPQPRTTTTAAGPTTTPSLPAVQPTSGVVPPSGSKPYGGSGDDRVCDREKLISFLTASPDRARAWAAVLGIGVDQIPAYVRSLVPTVLMYDTQVTNHGFANGRATPRQSILQAGTAVLVDSHFNPVVRCRCGNPLAPPVLIATPTLSGTPWPGFSPAGVVRVDNGVTVTVVINVVTVPSVGASSTSISAASSSSSSTSSTSTSTTASTPSNTDTSQIEGLLAVLGECTNFAPIQVVNVQPIPDLPGTVTADLVVNGVAMQFTYQRESGTIGEGDRAAAELLDRCGVHR